MIKIQDIILPDFLIVGAMKAGTTTVKDYLKKHSDVFIPQNELFFFSSSDYNKGLKFYGKFFEDYSNEKVVGEKTTTYSYDPAVPKRIFDFNPEIKLIWVLRDPVTRSYSNYWHSVKQGRERLSFEESIKKEKNRIRKDIFKGYIKRSIYIEQIDRYLEYFSLDQMHFIVFEEMIKKQNAELKRLAEFLGIEHQEVKKEIQSNVTYLPKSINIEYISCKLFGNTFPHKIIHKLNRKSSNGYPPMKEETRKYLRNYFTAYNIQLQELLNIDVIKKTNYLKPLVLTKN